MKVAAVQSQCGELSSILDLIKEAHSLGAELVVLPEACNVGDLSDPGAVKEAAEDLKDGRFSSELQKISRDYSLYIVAGLVEKEGNRVYNSAALIGPTGLIGRYRKLHLWSEEKLTYAPGNLGLPVFELPIGRVAMQICYDSWFPEVMRLYALRGAEVVCIPSAWIYAPDDITPESPAPVWINAAQAKMNMVYVICADRVDLNGSRYIGRSCIAGPYGFVAGPGSSSSEEVLVADIDLTHARRKAWNDLADLWSDRRLDVYDVVLRS